VLPELIIYNIKTIFMENSVYIRPLKVDDAKVSFNWRNNAKIWRFTGSKPDKEVTYEMERQWMEKVLERKNEKRFAICLENSGQYIGNVFFTDIENDEAVINIFIGELSFWGESRADRALYLLMDHGFNSMNLTTIKTYIRPKNNAALALAVRTGFDRVGEFYDESISAMLEKHAVTKKKFNEMLESSVVF